MWLILRKYKTDKIYKDKLGLIYDERVVAYNYLQNKIMNFALTDNFDVLLHNNKHKFTKKKIYKINIEEYEKIINDIEEKEIGASTKLYFIYIMKDFDNYKELNNTQKEKLLDFVYTYWIHAELTEHTIYDYLEMIFNSTYYGYDEIIKNINNITYEQFENIIEKNMFY